MVLPPEILSVIFCHLTVPDISPLLSIDERVKELVLGSVIQLDGNCTIRDLRTFPRLRSVSGMVHIDAVQDAREIMERCPNVAVHLNCECTASEVLLYPCIRSTSRHIGVGNADELKSLMGRDFIHLTLYLPYLYDFYPGYCEDVYGIISSMPSLKTLKIDVVIDSHIVKTLFKLEDGILHVGHTNYCIDGTGELLRIFGQSPMFISAIYRNGHLYFIDSENVLATMEEVIPRFLGRNVWGWELFCPSRINVIRRVLEGNYYFPSNLTQSWRSTVTFRIPVAPKQIPYLLRCFPNLRRITVVPTHIKLAPPPDQTILHACPFKTRKEVAKLRKIYPNVKFTAFF